MISNRPIKLMMAMAAVAVVGCSTIYEAREAQKGAKRLVAGAMSARVGETLSLKGSSLSQLVAFAMTNRPSVVAARLAVEDARYQLKQINADAPILSDTPWTAPKLSLSGGHNESSVGTTFRDHDWATKGDPSAAISLDLLIWDFGRHSAKAKSQAETVVASELALVKEGYVVFGEVMAAYFNYLEKHALLEVAVTNEARYATQCRYAEEREAAGEANTLDVLRARLDLTQARQTVVSVSNEVATTGATLMHALGVEASRGTCDQVIGKPALTGNSVLRGFAPTICGLDECYGQARTNAPSMRVERTKLKGALSDVDYAIADLLPSVSASASLSWTDPLWFFKWGFSATQSLFEGFKKTTAIDRARVALQQQANSVVQAEQDLSKNLELAIATRDNAIKSMDTASASVKSAQENYDMIISQWKVGDVSRVEVSDAVGELSTALGDRISAFYSGQRAEAAIMVLLGKTLSYDERVIDISKEAK